ncbi:PREDICTED: zinc finger protein 862-like [Branchiostoma belcheri]|uniref:Zinc finger protein 862-like n=1 Tax=Branchiostoma belcheri TaxID=7741 RepID=A0A6P4XYI1_BRABE|nr:PREDICTED: zinc finger protein 862-like [Branchiostoma belcheri]
MFEKDVSFDDSVGVWWLAYVEGEGMYCLLCKKHNQINTQNKSDKYARVPSVRFKRSAVTDHGKCNVHTRSSEIECQQKRGSIINKEFEKKQGAHFTAVFKAFSCAYFIARENVANRKFLPLLNFLEGVGVPDVKYFEHRSEGSIKDVFLTIGQTIQKSVIEQIQRSGVFGVLVDDVTDAAALEQMITFVQFVDTDNNRPAVAFLGTKNVLESHESANAEALLENFTELLDACGLEVSDIHGLCSDGASVMLGKKDGFAAKLKRLPGCKKILAFHCVCHKLALACCDTSGDLKAIKDVEEVLLNVWKWLSYSPKRTAAFVKCQLAIKGMAAAKTPSAQQSVCRKLKRACHTRWLSFDQSVKTVYADFWALLQTLSSFKSCPVATGLLKKMKSAKFLGILIIFRNVLPELAQLSKSFQANALNFSVVSPAIDYTKSKLREIEESNIIINQLRQDLDPNDGQFRHTEICLTEAVEVQVAGLTQKYTDALCQNIDRRFQDSLPVVSALSIFDPEALPQPESERFRSYGSEKISVLATHFFEGSEDKQSQLRAEWGKFKYDMHTNLKPQLPKDPQTSGRLCAASATPPTTGSATQWCLERVMELKTSYGHVYPTLVHIAKVALVLPLSNAWPERGASKVKLIKNRLRTRLGGDMLNALLNISINGPPVNSPDSTSMLTSAVKSWFAEKKRHGSKKLAQEIKQQRQQLRIQKTLAQLRQRYGEEAPPQSEEEALMDYQESESQDEDAEMDQLRLLEEADAVSVAKAVMGETPPDSGCDSDSDLDAECF